MLHAEVFLMQEGATTSNVEKAAFHWTLKNRAGVGVLLGAQTGQGGSTEVLGGQRKEVWPEQGVQLRPGRGERNSPAWWMQMAGKSNPNFTAAELCDPGVVTSPSLSSSFRQCVFL